MSVGSAQELRQVLGRLTQSVIDAVNRGKAEGVLDLNLVDVVIAGSAGPSLHPPAIFKIRNSAVVRASVSIPVLTDVAESAGKALS